MADVEPGTGARRDTGAHPAAEAGRFGPGPVLRLEITEHRDGLFDGAWWPYSHRVNIEIPRLIGGLAGHWDPVTRVGVDLETWGTLPTRLMVDGRVVRIDGYPVADDTALVTRDDRPSSPCSSSRPRPPPPPPSPRWPGPGPRQHRRRRHDPHRTGVRPGHRRR
ncbi:DUF5994 family protein [Streptomyces albidoflavus]